MGYLQVIITIAALGLMTGPETVSSAYLRGFYPRPTLGYGRSSAPTFGSIFLNRPGNWFRSDWQRQSDPEVDITNIPIDCSVANQRPSRFEGNYYCEIRTAGGGRLCARAQYSQFHLVYCAPDNDAPDNDAPECSYCNPPFVITKLSETEREDGCVIHEVKIGVEQYASENDACYLAVVNGMLQVSCPPDNLPDELARLFLHPVHWENEPTYYSHIKLAGYFICAQRNSELCQQEALLQPVVDAQNYVMSADIQCVEDA